MQMLFEGHGDLNPLPMQRIKKLCIGFKCGARDHKVVP